MPDQAYETTNTIFASKGIVARYADDAVPNGLYLNLDGLEEVEENGLATRLGSILLNKTGTVVNLLPGPVHSLSKLGGLSGTSYRYAGSGTNLYRMANGATSYTLISYALSGKPWTAVSYRPDLSSMPTLFIADAFGMLKDNGTLAAPQQNGIFQPQYPVQAQALVPDLIVLDNYTTSAGSYTYTGISGGTSPAYVATTITQAVTAGSIQTVTLASMQQVGLFQLLTIGGEVVLVIGLSTTGITAYFANAHASGTAIGSQSLSVTVPASTTATVSKSFAGTPISGWPTTLSEDDYIALYLYVSDPSQIQKITLAFDCGDGTFQSNYFYKIIGQGPLQTLLDQNSNSSTSAADAVLSDSLGLFNANTAGVSDLNVGLSQWTPLLIQLSDFAGAGRADFNDLVFNWNNVNGYQLEITTNDNTSVVVKLAALALFGGAGPDSFAGVSYDWLFTFYNAADGTESNPSMTMSNVNPPFQTNFITPRRQPVALTLNHPILDPQTTHVRVYQRGGTLADNYRRVDQVPCSGNVTQYTCIAGDVDIENADVVSFTNDVPVTSSLPVPVLTNLQNAINTTNQVVTVTPVSMANISVRQQVDLGNVINPNFEVVIVLSVSAHNFTAFVQNTHPAGDLVEATAVYGQPVTLLAQGGQVMYYAGDPNNPSYLYYSAASNPQAVGSASYIEISTPDDPITAVVSYKGNIFVSTFKRWWSIAPGQGSSPPVPYPTSADHGVVAPQGVCLMGDVIVYQAIDGWRSFSGGGSNYVSEIIEFVYQGVGTTPIVQADQTQLALTRMTYWNRYIFSSYIGVDGKRHRMILDYQNKRFRNDDVDMQSVLLESDINGLVYGDSNGLVHLDRQPIAYDEGNNGGAVSKVPIPINLQSPFLDLGKPAYQKQWNNFVLDANTNGATVSVNLVFNDGAFTEYIGTVTTVGRQKFNLSLNNGLGYQAYKVSVLLTSPGNLQRTFLYQAALASIPLAQTRTSWDSYWLNAGTAESKICKQLYIEYTAPNCPIVGEVYYDGSLTPAFTFTLPEYSGVRTSYRQRLPAIKCRLIRVTLSAPQDFMLWPESKLEAKPIAEGKGYATFPLGVQ